MAAGRKKYETRGRLTHYRGDLVICSAKHKTSGLGDKLPYGFALCIVEVYDCVPTENFKLTTVLADTPYRLITMDEWVLGNYMGGRFVWLTRNCRKLKEPVPVVGRQGFWNLPPKTVDLINAQLT
jgi:hypothetical protein